MLTNFEIDELAKKMRIDCIEGCYFKDELKYEKIKDNKAWIVNLASSDDDNDGTHWCILYNQINDKTKKREWIWFDSYAVIPPTDVMHLSMLVMKYPNPMLCQCWGQIVGKCLYILLFNQKMT